jgi:hypothetical protein
MFFVISADEFSRLSAMEVHEIFKHRHIVVTGACSPEDVKFDRDGLMSLGSLTARREIHGKFIVFVQGLMLHSSYLSVSAQRTEKDPDGLMYWGTLQDLLKTGDDVIHDGLNILNLPMGGASLPPPLQYRYVVHLSVLVT